MNDARQRRPSRAAAQARAERSRNIFLVEVPLTAPEAFMRPRHKAILVSFLLAVLLPAAAAAAYLWRAASDQYVSTLGFSVRTETAAPAASLVSSLIGVSSNGARDADILYKYLRSRDLVARIDAELDLRALYTKPPSDPVFRLRAGATIEDLTNYWSRMTQVSYDGNSGLIEMDIRSFDPGDSYRIARAVLALSTEKINDLSDIAREDTVRFARHDMEAAAGQLREARRRLTGFRVENRMVDPDADIQGQMGLLNALRTTLAEEMIANNLIRTSTTRENDPRLEQSERRIAIIRDRIEQERAHLGAGAGEEGPGYSRIVSDYESLVVDREFAEQRYLAARANYDTALAEAGRQSRYLAVYDEPALAEAATRPRRPIILGLTLLLLSGLWGLGLLIFYSIKDRR
ncbi:hypothetical protein [Celeribacter indicus]|uniref:Capsular polysaccharide transport system permease protein n=1 Tax=Celeribacter indicus TaxID=1208324 RepID=A0A0B5DU35_9RHOB|nr:hypothetical protein [Celeribacter indicus]AJE44730.1 hypothetical protein P73_0015 [Celeribacter indicus]SDX60507.1 capsular polysaccharide transport system permease protein [Celeribacter indicus]